MSFGGDFWEARTVKAPKLAYKIVQDNIGRPFTDIISFDPHNSPVRPGGQVSPQRRNLHLGVPLQ